MLWYYGELRDLTTVQNSADISDVANLVDRHVLSKIKPGTTAQELCAVLSKQPGGFFFASRFDIAPQILQAIAGNVDNLDGIWKKAMDIMQIVKHKEIDSAVLVAAVILSSPNPNQLLAPIQLDSEDILTGVKWFEHIQETIAIHRERKNYGGIGRDLSFGWAPVLNRIGYNVTTSIESGTLVHRTVASREEVIEQIMHLLSQPGKRNAAMVGESGVGKTTIVYSLAQKLIEQKDTVRKELRYHQLISLDAAHLISQAPGRGQLEELLIHVLNEAVAAKNIIIFLDDAQLFLKDGTGSVDLSSILLPVLQGGALKIIISLNDQEWLSLGQSNPGLAQLLNRVVVKPLDEADTLQVMEDQVLLLEAQNKIVYMRQALQESYKLSGRFIHEQAFPGKAIKLLEAAAGFPEEQHFITAKSVQQATEKAFDIKVQTADSVEERDTLLNLEERIHHRMINQSRAVKLVSDALRRARTGVRNENKPIGTFLFLGPTGVGKTELSKALASVYFGGEERMVRLDLNEFSHAEDTQRLLATGASDQYSLCAQISKQPFSVVLLDEIEKAHPNVLNLLLQLLDEGTLRDSENKPISFRDAVVIATSNAGADKIREHIQNGEQLEQFEETFVNELIDSQIFRPEFLNRFDEIILFRPLTPEELLQVVDLLMNQLNKRLAPQKVTVSLTQSAKELMAQTGYDPRLGARPLRRVMQRAVENVVAQKVLEGSVTPGQSIELDSPELQKVLDEH
jgi:ATP-dependent Clp protease ATP-binding subunit ClpC